MSKNLTAIDIMDIAEKANDQYWRDSEQTPSVAKAIYAYQAEAFGTIILNLQDRERRLEEELSQWQKFASYCRCCAQSGESDPMQFVDFVAEIARAALTPKGKA